MYRCVYISICVKGEIIYIYYMFVYTQRNWKDTHTQTKKVVIYFGRQADGGQEE